MGDGKIAWNKLATKTLTGTVDPITTSVFTSKQFTQFLYNIFDSGNVNTSIRLGKTSIDTGANYASRESPNGGADFTRINQNQFYTNMNNINEFHIGYFINVGTQEKLGVVFSVGQNTAGAGTAPARSEQVGKWTNTTNQFDIAELFDAGGTGSYTVDSNITILGTD